MAELTVPVVALQDFAAAVFARACLRQDDAQTIAADLVAADMRGLASHGVSRIPMYLERLRRGVVNPQPNVAVHRLWPAASLVDGDNGMGFLAAHKAVDEAIDLARQSGVGLVGVRRSTHFGMSALYVKQASDAGFISLVFTNSSPALPVWGGRTTFLGAAPFAAGVPGGGEGDYLLDMAMTVIARGKIRLAAKQGLAIEPGLALDKTGAPTTNASDAFEGVCLPFGGHKGAALAMLMDLLCGVLTGANFGGEVKSLYFDHSEPQNVGHLVIALRPDLFMPKDEFDQRMNAFTTRVKGLPRALGFNEILMPGEPEDRKAAKSLKEGISLPAAVVADLREEARRLEVAADVLSAG
ncbi:Ldh family oxidoreductase [Bradyrhizobium iriomotense]|uniref:Lactate dehydrogenase n=1 Tax=Bradyrhizobium iriomotense TaxID=441950 RepID=A0ABQ6B5P0_9BRAD|nr:Ldh family oxidoreductase [Bradyrhizobium iriomotense]GLR88759.1 lactate dehydrogenase [Bradyrhizobium iriomotense]